MAQAKRAESVGGREYGGGMSSGFPRLHLHTGKAPNGAKKEVAMTDTTDINIEEALKLIDAGLGLTMSRELMSTSEVCLLYTSDAADD